MEPRAQDQQTLQQFSFEQRPTQASEPLQVDPMLEMSESHPASGSQKLFATVAAIAVLSLLFYGLNHQRDETQQTASASTAETTGAAPSSPAPSKPELNPSTPKQPVPGQASHTPDQKAQNQTQGSAQQNQQQANKPAQAQQPQQPATTTGQGNALRNRP